MNTAVVLSATGSRKPVVTAIAWPGPIRALLIRVTLPDGTQHTVLVPQVYAKVKAGNLTGDGALLGGGSVAFNAQKDITSTERTSGRQRHAGSGRRSQSVGGAGHQAADHRRKQSCERGGQCGSACGVGRGSSADVGRVRRVPSVASWQGGLLQRIFTALIRRRKLPG